MVQEYFNEKKPLQDINPDEVVAYGAILAANLDLNIHDITSKAIGIVIQNRKMDIIIPVGTALPFIGKNLLKFAKIYNLDNVKKDIVIKIYEGNNETIDDNFLLGDFVVKVGKENKGKKLKISMTLNHNSILKVEALVKDENNNETKIVVKLKK